VRRVWILSQPGIQPRLKSPSIKSCILHHASYEKLLEFQAYVLFFDCFVFLGSPMRSNSSNQCEDG
jgi:hypothetical protein